MVNICIYFQVHQPYRLRNYNVFDIGNNSDYFDDNKNKEILQKVANKCYLPANRLLLHLIQKYKGKFKIAFSITGVVAEQIEKYSPETLESFKQLADTGCVEFLSETYYHSLSFLFSKDEFKEQILMHKQLMKRLFNVEPSVFRNTELIYNNELANFVQGLGYKAILAEGADHVLGWRSPNFVYTPKTAEKLKLLLKNYKLSDDIAFRFGDRSWKEHPLTAVKFANWVTEVPGEVVNLFMDYETFGEHQWEDSGIFNFLEHLPNINEVLRGISNNLKEDAVGLVEVPNFDMILRNKLFSEFISDHLYYFTTDTLRMTLERNGFEIIECKEIWYDYIISAVVRKRKKTQISHFKTHQQMITKEIKGYISRYGSKKVAIYGAGHQALAIISLTNIKNDIKYIIDDATFKQDKYTPATHIPIVSKEKLLSDPVEAVLVMAASYSDEVAKKLRKHFGKTIDIAILRDDSLEICEG